MSLENKTETQQATTLEMLRTSNDTELASLSADYKKLKCGATKNTFEPYESKCHVVMTSLLNKLKHPGTPVEVVVEALGEPHCILDSFDAVKQLQAGGGQAACTNPANVFMMPGPFVPKQVVSSSAKVWLVYSWRGTHDFIYFETDDRGEKVVKGDWMNASFKDISNYMYGAKAM